MYAPHHLITWLFIGLIAGMLAGRVARGRGFGCLGDVVVGLAGAFVGGIVVENIAPDARLGFLSSIVVAFFGALLLAYITRALFGGTDPRRLSRSRRR